MQTNYSPRAEHDLVVDEESSFSIHDLLRTIREYAHVVVVSLLCVMVGYAIFAIASYLFRTPAVRVTSEQFRLDFDGAGEGRYPNGLKFSPVEIVSGPVLQKVYKRNDLGRFVSLDDFSRSVFVLQSNPAYDALVFEYQARLADTRLQSIDRDRLQREFDMKRDALARNVFALNFEHNPATERVPESIVRNALIDTLHVWSDIAVNEQHAFDYRVSVLSPDVVGTSVLPSTDYLPRLLELRSQVMAVMDNVALVGGLPGAELVKTSDQRSLEEIRLRLEEIVRFRIDPLMTFIAAKHLIKDPAETVRFAQNQLEYDQRKLDSQLARADAVRQALAIYSQRTATERTGDASVAQAGAKPQGETLMPQFSESFLDKLVDLTAHSADAAYRQKLANNYRTETEAIIPLTAAVAFDRSVIEQLRSTTSGGTAADEAFVNQSLKAICDDVRQMVMKVNEIYRLESSNLRPATQLYTVTAPPVTRIERTGNSRNYVIGGVLVTLISLVVIVLGVMIHSRFRSDDESEVVTDAAPLSSPALP